jgi:16S rRNA (adenine1518-N6/adenine1519-N6)-dimethyltransferase
MASVVRKRFGQHFLTDRNTVARIVAAIAPKRGEVIVEIGPGRGVLTEPLIELAGRVRAIEIDRDLAAALRVRYNDEQLELVQGDALDYDYRSLPERARVVGNLPYNISTPLLFRLAAASDRLCDLHFMLQKEVVERMAASHSTPAYGRLSVMIQHAFRVERLFDVPPGAFLPPPKVVSSVVRLQPRSAAERGSVREDVLRQVVTAAFSKRRKTLGNALGELVPAVDLVRLGVDPKLRPENLGPADYAVLARHLAGRLAGN